MILVIGLGFFSFIQWGYQSIQSGSDRKILGVSMDQINKINDPDKKKSIHKDKKLTKKNILSLKTKFTSEHQLIQIIGQIGLFGVEDFSPTDPVSVRQRAIQIIESLRNELKIRSDSPLSEPLIRPSETSAQVTFEQTYQGRKMIPGGMIDLDLGPQGELIRLDSYYQSDFSSVEKVVLEQQDAEKIVENYYKKSKEEGVVQVSDPVNFVANSKRIIPSYRFYKNGIETLISAHDGTILSSRNRKNH